MARKDEAAADAARRRARWEPRDFSPARSSRPAAGGAVAGRLVEVESFGANPGKLRMMTYAPPALPEKAPLVVVLHGCTQSAAGYEAHAGWTRLAETAGFAVLYPEQQRSNNPQGCFNWFHAADSARGLGETRSIRAMIDTMVDRHDLDPDRIFVTGLSAGGAMASALLADYPEVFAGGAVIAGLPCGAAANVQEALQAMARPHSRSPQELGDAVRAGSPHRGPWPIVSIWHGAADSTVVPQNADELVKQWTDVHGVPIEDFREEASGGHRRRVWSVEGRDVVEFHLIAGMGHGAPLDVRAGERAGPFMLDASVSSTRRIAAFFGLDGGQAARAPRRTTPAKRPDGASASLRQRSRPAAPSSAGPARGEQASSARERDGRSAGGRQASPAIERFDVSAMINRALKAAGLMK